MAKLNELELLYLLLGQRIRKAREQANLTQSDLAEKLDLVRTSVVNIEAGRQRLQLHDIYRVAQVLNVSLNDLLPENTPKVLKSQADILVEWAEQNEQ